MCQISSEGIEKSCKKKGDTEIHQVTRMDEVQYLLEAKSDLCARGLGAEKTQSNPFCGHEQVAMAQNQDNQGTNLGP